MLKTVALLTQQHPLEVTENPRVFRDHPGLPTKYIGFDSS